MTAPIPQKPSKPSYTEIARERLEATGKPLGLFWSLVSVLLAIATVTGCYVVIRFPFLFRFIAMKWEDE